MVTNREAFAFVAVVESAFSFLVEDYGFRMVGTDVTLVRFAADKMFLNVYHGRQSYEIGVEVGRPASAYRYRLPEVLGALLGESGQQDAYYLQSSSREGLRRCVEAAARLVKAHYGPVLSGNPDVLERIGALTTRRNEEYTRRVVQQPIRDAAHRAWLAKDFAMVARCYGSIREDLSPPERRRLTYAEKQISK
jgi:hypothetical protein